MTLAELRNVCTPGNAFKAYAYTDKVPILFYIVTRREAEEPNTYAADEVVLLNIESMSLTTHSLYFFHSFFSPHQIEPVTRDQFLAVANLISSTK